MKRILYVLHSGTTGGTFLTSKDLMKHVEKEYSVFLLTAENDVLRLFNYNKENFELIKEYPRMKKWSAKNFHDSWLSYIYFDILVNFNIDLVHIRHFINHSFDLPVISKKLDIPVVVSLHDFYLACPFYTLLDENNKYCGGKCKNNSLNCYNSLLSLSDINSKEIINQWRDEVSHMMKFVDYVITTADFVKDVFISVYPQMNYMDFDIIEHGRDFPKLDTKYYELPTDDKPLKILCPANYLNEMKGSEFIKQLKKEDVKNRLEFHFLGNCRNGVEEYGINHGPFERDEYYQRVKEISPSFVGIFSIWPETFCHTLTEAWSCGIPVIGSNIGVIQDRILNSNGGWVLDIDNPKKSYEMILSIADDIDGYNSIAENISNFSLKTTYQMSEEYLEVYDLLLDRESTEFIYINPNDFEKNKEIISESNLFDNDFYLARYSDVKKSKMNPLEHWIKWGYKEMFRDPNNNFSNNFYSNHYLSNNPLEWNSLTHYLVTGKNQGNKRSIFDSNIYEYDLACVNDILEKLSGDISIMVLVNDYSDKLSKCINSLINNTLNHFELILLDFNNIGKELSNFIESYPNINAKIISNDGSKDISEFLNEAFKQTLNDIVLLNGYSEFSYNWLTNLIIKAYSDNDINFVSPLSNFVLEINQNDKEDLFNLTVEGINHVLKKSSRNFNLKSNYGDGLVLYIKNNSKNNLIFDENLFKEDISSNMLFIDFKTNQHHVFADDTYVEHDLDFVNNIFKCRGCELKLYKNELEAVNENLNEAIQYITYKSLANRILFVTDDLTRNKLVFDKIKHSYNCYFLVNDGKNILLYDDLSIIKSWDLTDISTNLIHHDDLLKNIYFNILVSLNIDLVQIDTLINNSFDLSEICNLLNIQTIVNCFDDYYINPPYLDENSDEFNNLSNNLFRHSDVVFNKPTLKESYLKHFSSISNYKIVNDEYIDKFEKIVGDKLNKCPIELFIFGDFDINIVKNISTNLFKFHFFNNFAPNLENGINHGSYDFNKLKEISPDFILIFDSFHEIFEIFDYSQSEKVPILINDDEMLYGFVDELPGIGYLNTSSSNSFVESILKYHEPEEYINLLCDLFDNDSFNQNLSFVLYEYYDLYLKSEKNPKIITSESIFNNSIKKSNDFSDIQGFLANSYVSPIIHAPFSEEEKRCFAVMDNISKYLMNCVDKNDYNPLVSIIMPVYNRVNTIDMAIESVLSQNYGNIELIIVDDGSTDGTKDILSKVNNDKINVIFHNQNKGASKARNTALINAKGDIIMYLDSDNLWDQRYVKTMLGAFVKLPDADALYSGQLLYKDSSKPSAVRFGAFNKSLFKNKNYIDLNCLAHKKEVFLKTGGFNEDLNRLIDWDFILRINNQFKIYSIPVLLSKYYFDEENRITNNALGNIGIRYSNINYMDYIKNKNLSFNDSDLKLNHKINIIIPSYESLHDLRDCINSILSLNLDNHVKIIIIDNNSGNSVKYYLDIVNNHENIEVIKNDINYGFTYAVNQGIDISDDDSDILILNNDAILTKNSLEIMQKAAYDLEDSGIIVPQQILKGNTPTITTHVPYANPIFECDVNPSKHHKNIINMPLFHNGEILELNFAPFFCAYIKRDILNQTCGLDAELGRHYRSDRIFSDYVRNLLNLKIYHISDAVVYHKLQKSTNKLKKDNLNYDIMFLKNQWDESLARKLGFNKASWDE